MNKGRTLIIVIGSVIVISIISIYISTKITLSTEFSHSIYAVAQGKFVANSPQLEEYYYTLFLTNTSSHFQTIYALKSHPDLYNFATFGEENTFDLILYENRWVITGIRNSNGDMVDWNIPQELAKREY